MLPALLLAGCESEAEVAAEMERGLLSTNEAVAAALFATEALAPVVEPVETPVARHGTACGECPCVTLTGLATGPHQLTLDYEPGCVPTSGLLPTLLSGHTEIAWTGAEAMVAWANLVVRLEDPVAGTLGGPVVLEADGTVIDAAGAFSIGEQGYDLDVTVVVDDEGVTMDGTVDVRGPKFGAVDLDGVVLTYDGIRSACPTPDAGTATLRNVEKPDKDVVVDLAGSGTVTVERDGRLSEAVDLCAYATDRI